MRTRHYPLILKFFTLGLLTQIWLVSMIGCCHRRRPEPSPPSPELSQVTDSIIEELPFPDHQATVNVSPDAGAVLVAGTSQGDIIWLAIPPYAVDDPIEVTLTAIDAVPSGPIAQTASGSFQIEPEGTRLRHPAAVDVRYATPLDAPEGTRIFELISGERVRPIGRQAVVESSGRGVIYHFSTYFTGTPLESEIEAQLPEAPQELEFGDLNDFQYLLDQLMEWAKLAEQLGNDAVANDLFDTASRIAERQAESFLNQPISEAACGEYLETLITYGKIVGVLVPMGDLANQYRQRASSLLNECPLEGHVMLRAYSIPACMELKLTNSLEFTKEAEQTLAGTTQTALMIGGPGLIMEGVRVWFRGRVELEASVSGQLEVSAPFEVKLVLDVGFTKKFQGQFEMISNKGTLAEADFDSDLVIVSFPSLGGWTFQVPFPYEEIPLRLVFPYRHGAQIVEEHMSSGIKMLAIWSLHLAGR